jgi:hypothetical protein
LLVVVVLAEKPPLTEKDEEEYGDEVHELKLKLNKAYCPPSTATKGTAEATAAKMTACVTSLRFSRPANAKVMVVPTRFPEGGLGRWVGTCVGAKLGSAVGSGEGRVEGATKGRSLGATTGAGVGGKAGLAVGGNVRKGEGWGEGGCVGYLDGEGGGF